MCVCVCVCDMILSQRYSFGDFLTVSRVVKLHSFVDVARYSCCDIKHTGAQYTYYCSLCVVILNSQICDIFLGNLAKHVSFIYHFPYTVLDS